MFQSTFGTICLLGLLLIHSFGSFAQNQAITAPANINSTGYRGVSTFGNDFIAVGSAGRIDQISAAGKVLKTEQISGENFNCVLTDNARVIVAGQNGSIYVSVDKGAFKKVNSDCTSDINSLVLFRGTVLAGANDGIVVSGDNKDSFKKTYLPVAGNIVSLSARKNDCFGVTDAGEIIRTTDGKNWEVFNFNEVYAGFYKSCSFTAVAAGDKQIGVAGVATDGSPVLMFSNQGNVWSDRSLNYTDEQGVRVYPEDTPNGLYYDAVNDLFFMACTNGKMMKIPSCSHCNRLFQLSSGNLTSIAGSNGGLIVVGAGYFVQYFNPIWE